MGNNLGVQSLLNTLILDSRSLLLLRCATGIDVQYGYPQVVCLKGRAQVPGGRGDMEKSVQDLPSNGRNLIDAIQLQTGVNAGVTGTPGSGTPSSLGITLEI
jgi:hypothetical protein